MSDPPALHAHQLPLRDWSDGSEPGIVRTDYTKNGVRGAPFQQDSTARPRSFSSGIPHPHLLGDCAGHFFDSGISPHPSPNARPLPSQGVFAGERPTFPHTSPHATFPRSLSVKAQKYTLQFLKGTPALSVIPVVMLSSSDDPDDIRQAYLLGASSYFIKPRDL